MNAAVAGRTGNEKRAGVEVDSAGEPTTLALKALCTHASTCGTETCEEAILGHPSSGPSPRVSALPRAIYAS
jgi:hypothetical protein